MTPATIGRYSVIREGHQSEIESFDYRLLGDARRFEAGNYNWIGLAAAHASMGELLAIGVASIDVHVTRLARSLGNGLRERAFTVNQPSRAALRSHLVTVGHLGSGSAYSSSDPRLNRFAAALEKADVNFSVRRGFVALRLSLLQRCIRHSKGACDRRSHRLNASGTILAFSRG